MSIADHSDQLHSQAEIASLAGVSRATITQWRRAPGFPSPVRGGETELFRRSDFLAWLDRRPVPRRLLQGDPDGTTYGARARMSLDRDRAKLPAPLTAHQPEAPDAQADQRDADRVRELMGQLCDRVRGAGSRVDYVNLLVSLHFLRRSNGSSWDGVVEKSRTGEGSDGAAALLQHVATTADEQLRLLGMRPAMRQALVRLEPRSYGDLRQVVHLVGELGPGAFELMLDEYELLAGLDSGEFFTPRAVARVMARIAEWNVADGNELQRTVGDEMPPSIYDPYARGGELLAAATAQYAARGGATHRMRVRGLTHGRDTAPLAIMNLALRGARPVVRVSTGAPPWADSLASPTESFDLVLSNPPFNMSDSTGEARGEGDWPYGPPPLGNDNLAYVQHMLNTLREGGSAAVIMPNKAGNSANASETRIRRQMVERGAVKAAVALPDRLFSHTSVPVSLWFLVHPSQACDEVKFLDARQVGTTVRGKRVLGEKDVRAILDAYRSRVPRDGDEDEQGTGVGAGTDTEIVVPTVTVPRAVVGERNWSLSPVDHIEAHTPRRNTAEGTLAEALDVLAMRQEEAREADAAAAAASAVENRFARAVADGWRSLRLSDLCRIQAGPSFSVLKRHMTGHDGVPLVYPQNLREGRIRELADDRKVSWEQARHFDRFRLQAGDIVCVRTGAMGAPALVREVGAGWLMSSNVIRLRVEDEHHGLIHPGYLAAYLGRPESVAWVRDRATATGAPSISVAALGNQPLVIPPYEEQLHVVSVLDTLDAQAAAHSRLAEAVAATRDAVVGRQMVSDLTETSRTEAGAHS
ncbi:N-6 DNA methylase [Streptomyces sp. NPDC051840]|uniref:N-6 DNA methylase n=1 Tax=Streptomyces sp. NPDC051840 TaxID=3154752 RepID=UPI003441524C